MTEYNVEKRENENGENLFHSSTRVSSPTTDEMKFPVEYRKTMMLEATFRSSMPRASGCPKCL